MVCLYRLCLNISKTSLQLYSKKQSQAITPVVKIDQVQIKEEKVVKFLGLLVDEDLSFKQHIDYVCQKVSIAIGFMFRGKPIFEKPQLVALYNALLLPHLSYCNTIWAINYPTHTNRLFLLQKRAARVILGLPYHESVSHRFSEIDIKPLTVIRDLRCLLLAYKIKHVSVPHSIRNLIQWKEFDPDSPQLRNNGITVVPYSRTVYRQHTFRVHVSRLLNYLHALNPIVFSVPISTFKKTLKEQLIAFCCN